jgi:hypothetical protein
VKNAFILLFPALLHSAAIKAAALSFPDTAELKKTHRVVARKDGRPILLCRILDGDSMSLALEWDGGRPVAARLEREDGYSDADFTRLTEEYGEGAAWHEHADGGKPPYEGLQQQWILKGYGKGTGWLGAGLHRGRHFLVFRDEPPSGLARVEEPLALGAGVAAYLDSSSLWLKVACKESEWGPAPLLPAPKPPARSGMRPSPAAAPGSGGKPVCYRSNEDTRMWVRVRRAVPPALEIRLEEGESPALKEIRRVVQTVPDAAQADYARDLSQILLAESQIVLAKLAQRLPVLFNQPSWQLQGSKEGQVPSERFLALVRSREAPDEFLPALHFDGRNLAMAMNLYYRGTFHLNAESKP